jgi:hypothetical protein
MRSLIRCCALLLILLPVGSAQALLSVDSGTSTLTDGQICSSTGILSCFTPLFQLGSAATVTGGSLDITGTTLNFSFSVTSAVFSGSDGPVTSVALSDVTYAGSFAVTPSGSGFTFQDQLANVSGTLTPTGGGAASLFANASVNTTGQCTGTPGSSLLCGFLFGPTGSGVNVNGNVRYLRQSVNVTAVPEPGTAILFGLGLTALAASRKSSR